MTDCCGCWRLPLDWVCLHEYYHVLEQWNTGEMTRRSYLAEVARSGSWAEGNKYEEAADAFADSNFAAFQDCLDKAKECD